MRAGHYGVGRRRLGRPRARSRCSARTRAAGRSSPARIRANASRFSAPATVTTTSSARAIAGNVNVSRGCGCRSSPVGTTKRSVSSSAGEPGNSDAVCPSGRGRGARGRSAGRLATSCVVRGRRRLDASRRRRYIEWIARGSTSSRNVDAGHALVGVGIVRPAPSARRRRTRRRATSRRRRSRAARSTAARSRRPRARSTRALSSATSAANACGTSSTISHRAPSHVCDDTAVDRDDRRRVRGRAPTSGATRAPARFTELARGVRTRRSPAGALARSTSAAGPGWHLPALGRPGRRARRGVRDGSRSRARPRRTRGRVQARPRAPAVPARRARRRRGRARATCTSPRTRLPVVADGAAPCRSRSVRPRRSRLPTRRRRGERRRRRLPRPPLRRGGPTPLRDVLDGAGFDVDDVRRRRRGVDRRRGDAGPHAARLRRARDAAARRAA